MVEDSSVTKKLKQRDKKTGGEMGSGSHPNSEGEPQGQGQGGQGGRPRTVVTRQEKVDVYILQQVLKTGPASSAGGVGAEKKLRASTMPPDESDASVRGLRRMKGMPLQYSFPAEWQDDRKKVQEKRELALLKLKKKCLRIFEEENPELRAPSMQPSSTKKAEGIASKGVKASSPTNKDPAVKMERTEGGNTKTAQKSPQASEEKKNKKFELKPSKSGLAEWRRQCLFEANPPSLAEAANLLFGVEKPKAPKMPPLAPEAGGGSKKRSASGSKRSLSELSRVELQLPSPPSPHSFGQVFWCDNKSVPKGQGKTASGAPEPPKTPTGRKVSVGDLQSPSQLPEDIWVACDKCTKWRRLPADTNPDDLPQRWFCHMNPDRDRANCSVPEEAYADKAELPDPMDQMKRRRTGLWLTRQKCRERFEAKLKQRLEESEIKPYTNKPNKFNWIRCCNPSCRRWRVLNSAVPPTPTSIMDPSTHREMEWYCWMNSWDETVASCAAPEEIGYDHCIQTFANEDLEFPTNSKEVG